MSENTVIALEGLSFRWAKAHPPCLDIAHFSIEKGERLFLYGPSGSGKSTLLGLLGGVLMPQQGIVQILGTDLCTLSAAARDRFRVDHIGFIFQQFNLVPHLSVIDNVLLPCRFSKRRRERAVENGHSLHDEALRLFAHLDLAPGLHQRPVNTLSVGQQQRVAAARALIGQPEIIIADEPTSALDAARQEEFLHLLLQECRLSGASVLFVSHDRRLSNQFDRTVALGDINRACTVEAA